MSPLIAHPQTKADVDAIVAAPRACYMLVGAPRSGRLAVALYIARMLHCGGQEGCASCKRIMAGSDPDVIQIKPNEKGSITIEMAHDVVSSLSRRSNRVGATRLVIIQSAERLTVPAQNALLKVIEEPPVDTILLLLVSNAQSILSTIRSRCQTVFIRPVAGLPDIARGRAGLMKSTDMISDIHLDTQKDINISAENILKAAPLARILMVDKLAADKNLVEIIDCLAYLVSKAVRDQKATSQALKSMQNYFIYTQSGVNNKHALMELMIQL